MYSKLTNTTHNAVITHEIKGEVLGADIVVMQMASYHDNGTVTNAYTIYLHIYDYSNGGYAELNTKEVQPAYVYDALGWVNERVNSMHKFMLGLVVKK